MSGTQADPNPAAGAPVAPAQVPAPAADPAPKTALTADPPTSNPTPATAAPQTWPDDWRQKVVGSDDAKELARIQRYASPADLYKAYRAAEQKISSGEFKAAEPAADAKPEEIAAWRKENGIPEAPEGYLEKLPDGVKIENEDGPLLKTFVAEMHKLGAPPKYVHAAIKSYFDVQQVIGQELAELDQTGQRGAEDTLRSEWGNEYRANLNAIHGVLGAHLGEQLAGLIDARLPDGTKVGNSAELIKGLLAIAKEVNPAATIVPASGGNAGQGIDQRLAELTKMMGDRKSDYWNRGAVGEKLQAEFRQLVEARDRMQARAA